ncbi:MAG: chemotaxis protein CheD [Thermoflexaceae bacterium]|nr:chemotaxis protein CheD [Thermoflexaceae bacterium]
MTAPAADLRRISVGIGQLAVSKDSREVLIAYGLGSCIGVSAHDPGTGVCAMVHILLPASEGKVPQPNEPARFADSGVDALLKQMIAAGASRSRLVLKLAGGAAVLGPGNAEKFKIGERNADAIKERLKLHGLRAAREDLGGTRGRTLELQVASGKTFVRTAASPAIEL